MFKILKFKSLAIVSLIICCCLLLGAAVNVFSPYADVFSDNSTEIPIIMYHQITDNASASGKYVITAELLRQDFSYMQEKNIHPISLKQLEKYTSGLEALPENPVILTFDDGARSFLTKVIPLLEDFSYPAVVNIVGSLVELYTENGDTDDRYAYLNSEDVKAVFSHPLCEIGCHSYELHSLSNRRGMSKLYGESDEEYEAVIREDIRRFQEMFSKLTGEKTRYFAYPYGMKNDTLEKILEEEGFRVLLTCRESANTISVGSSLNNLGRFNRPNGKSPDVFFDGIFK